MSESHMVCPDPNKQRIVLVLQGGGALGAYQAGVYQAMNEAGLRPDWVIGTSIGAINAALIAGNPPEKRVERLNAFWDRMQRGRAGGLLENPIGNMIAANPFFGQQITNLLTMTQGLGGFFKPNPLALASHSAKFGAEAAGLYSTEPLRETLSELIDFDLINSGACRLTTGAANVRTARMTYFDSRDTPLDLRHVMASGALPPAFPAIRIGEDLFWDGGIVSNTPVEAVFDDDKRADSLVFVVHVWNPSGQDPESITDVISRQKDLQYASRAHSHVMRQEQIHNMRRMITELASMLPQNARSNPRVAELEAHGCLTQMHIVRLLAPQIPGEDSAKDIDFTPNGVKARWAAGLANTKAALAKSPWQEPHDRRLGFILHEANSGIWVDQPTA